MKLKYILLVVAAVVCMRTTAAGQCLNFDGEGATSVGVYIKDIGSGEVMVDHNSELSLTPASVMKAITTASALSVLNPDSCFSTPVVLRGSKGPSGTWSGDLVVRAVADPTLESNSFKNNLGFADRIVSALKAKGITRITGAVVVEGSLSDAGPLVQWEIEDVVWPYGAGLFAFNYRDNSATLYPNTGKTRPEVPGLKVTVRRQDGPNNLIRGVNSNNILVYTRNPKDTRWALDVSVPDPAAVFRAELKGKLSAAGITVGSKAVDAKGGETVLLRQKSPRFSEIMRNLMIHSDNLFAEGMLRSIAPGASRKAAIKREKELWATRGINTSCTLINDGSGLTRANRLSPRFIGDVLEWMAKSDRATLYASFFPKAGREGTLKSFLKDTRLEGRVALKTGSVSSVQCYAGYVLDDARKPTHVVVIMVNGFFCPRREVRRGAEELLLKNF